MLTAATTGLHRRGARRTAALYGDDLAPGAIVGAYRVEALAARGGFATVYRARHLTLARTVAIKVLRRDLATSADTLRRFIGEAHAVNRIAHPNVVDIGDVGTLRDGRPYLVMEWLTGRPLESELAARGPLTALEALAVMEDLLPALAAAHDAGVIHRDLTATNVIATPRGHGFSVKLVDFGIAKLVDAEHGGPRAPSEVGLGTPSHMAPEQFRGGEIDERTDVYGAGVLLFQLLTGELPFRAGSSLELADLHLEAIAPRVSSYVPALAAVDDVVARCLAKAPAERWRSARALLSALRAAVAGPRALADPGREEAKIVRVERCVDPPAAPAPPRSMRSARCSRTAQNRSRPKTWSNPAAARPRSSGWRSCRHTPGRWR